MSFHSISKLLASLSLLACTSVFAAPVTVGVDNVQSVGLFGDAGNTLFDLFVGANASITNISYNVNLTAYDSSKLSDINLAVTDSAVENGVLFAPAMNANNSGTGMFAGTIDLVFDNSVFSVGSDGILHFEFFEAVDDLPGSDGQWNFGTITFEVVQAPVTPAVPEPATVLLMAAGLAMMGYAARRRA